MSRLELHRRSAMLEGAAGLLGAALPRMGHAQEAPRRGGTLVAQTFSDLRILNPAIRTSFAIHVYTSKMVEPLVDLEPDGRPAPRLPVSWQSPPNPKPLTFALPPRVLCPAANPF